MRGIIRIGALAGLAMLLSPEIANADTNGKAGRIIQLTVNSPGSDNYGQFHGSIVVRSGDAKTTYRWGGSNCPNANLSDATVARLAGAFHTRRWTKILPKHKTGQGGAKCLVAFDLKGKAKEGPS